MAITAKVRNKQIDTGKVLHALVQGEHASGNITFQIIGEEELVEDFNSTYFYLLYTRPADTRPNVLLLTNKQLQDDVISVTFKPTSYFTAQDGTVQIQIMATDTEGLSVDSETGTISGSVIWQTFPGAMFVHASQLTGAETIIEENVLTQYLAGMQELNTQTEQAATEAQQAAVDAGEDAEAAAGSATAAQNAKTDAVAARDKAQEWATKLDGKVDNIDYSAKHYAFESKASEQKASEWAEKETAVETGKYSAKHWAEQAHAEFNALDTYVDETLKPALDGYEETKEGELDTYTATKKAELDTYEGTKETELNTYTGTKKTELDTYTGAKKSELDSYVANTSKPSLDSYTNNTLKPALLAYEQTQEGTLNTYTGTKKSELDTYVTNTSKPAIDDYIEDEKKPEIDAYIEQQAGQFGDDVTTLKGNVSALDKRVSNLEESLDVIKTIEYPDATYGTGEVPPNKSKYAAVEALRGVSRAENQLAHELNSTYWEFNGSSGSFSDGVATFTATANRGKVNMKAGYKTLPKEAGHTVFISVEVKTTTATDKIRIYAYGGYVVKNCVAYTNWQTISLVVTTNSSWGVDLTSNNIINVEDNRTSGWDAVQVKNVIVRDLTFYFGGNIPSDAQTISDIQKNHHELLVPKAYNTGSIVDSTYSAVKSVGVNIWDEVTELGDLNGNNGADYPDSNRIRSKNKNPIVGGIAHYLKCSVAAFFCYYDGNENFIRSVSVYANSSFTPPANAWYFRFSLATSYGTTYNHDIQICLDSYTDKTTHHAYMTDTLTLPEPVTLRSAGSIADELDVESGEVTRNIGSVDLSTLNWTWDSSYWEAPFSLAKLPSTSDVKGNIVHAIYENRKASGFSATGDNGIALPATTVLRCKTTSSSVLPTGILYYEKATPTTEQTTPILDPFIQVEGGGTIKPVQTNDPEIDSAMTVTYVNKITA